MTQKRGVLSRADLVKLLDSPTASEWMAEKLFLVEKEQPKQTAPNISFPPMVSPFGTPSIPSLQTEPVKKTQTIAPTPSSRPKTKFWYLADRGEQVESSDEERTEETAPAHADVLDEEWRNRPTKPPTFKPLLDQNALIAKLDKYLQHDSAGRKVDLDKVVSTLSKAQHLARLPRKQRKRQQRHLHIIDDRSRHLTPYWNDHDLAKLSLLQARQAENISFSVLMSGEEIPHQLTAEGLADWQCPNNSTVIVLSDLGALERYSSSRQQTWKHLGQQLKQKQCTLTALLPCNRHAVSKQLHHLFNRQSWDDNERDVSEDDEQQLLSYLSPCIRIEPGLLREIRYQFMLPISLESIVWQNTAIESPHSVAASWQDKDRKHNLAAFDQLEMSQKELVLRSVREWRQPLDKQVWYEEVTTVAETCSDHSLVEQDIRQAEEYFSALSKLFKDEVTLEEKQATQSWYRRFWKRLPEACQTNSPTLQKIAERVHKDQAGFDPKGINPQNLPESDEPLVQAVLFQQGNKLRLQTFEPFRAPERAYSRLALVNLRHRFVQVLQGEKVLGSLKLDGEAGISLSQGDHITLKSDLETLNLKTLTAPENINVGRDTYGLYADIEFNEVDQRFRYIEPGEFMMGSPEDEQGRLGDEDYHKVILTKGYWLSDTACTQALWQAVMSDNPSQFIDNPENPVEKVSWNRVQEFLVAVNQLIPDIDARLPTEAEWEYACRSGSQTPFNFEGELDHQLNYRGLWHAQKDIRGEYEWHPAAKRKTVPVKQYEPNELGLFQMHGNVFEWCKDGWKQNLGVQTVKDPYIQPVLSGGTPDTKSGYAAVESVGLTENLDKKEDDSGLRVLRGGSWNNLGGRCRSAFRYRYGADNRVSNVGFRFSLGLELTPSQVARSALSEADSKRVAEQRVKAVKAGRAVMSTDPNLIKKLKETTEFMAEVRGSENGWSPDSIDEPLSERISKGIKNLFGRKK